MRRFTVLTLILGLAASGAFGQSQEGDTELQLQGSISLAIDGDGADTGSIFVTYGRFLTDHHEVGGTVAAFLFDGDVAGTGGPFWRYNFGSGERVPYVGAAAVTGFGDFSASDILVNLEAGVRFFLERNTAFSVAGSTLYDVDESDFSDNLQILFGFSYFWER